MRITENLILRHAIDNLTNSRSRLYDLQKQIATQKRVLLPEDDPFAAERAVGLRSALRANQSYERSIDLSLEWLNATESTLTSVQETIQKAHTLTLSAATDALGEDERASITTEIKGLFEQAVAAANTRYHSRYVLSGYQTTTAPFTLDTVTYAWTYNGDAGQIDRAIGPGESFQVNLLGDQAFQDAFDAFEALITTLDTPGVTAEDINDHLDDLEQGLDTILQNVATVGNRVTKLEETYSRLEDLDIRLEEELSKAEDADMAEAVTRLQHQEAAYGAMIQVVASLNDQPLLIELVR